MMIKKAGSGAFTKTDAGWHDEYRWKFLDGNFCEKNYCDLQEIYAFVGASR
jgi:hypothetical protein